MTPITPTVADRIQEAVRIIVIHAPERASEGAKLVAASQRPGVPSKMIGRRLAILYDNATPMELTEEEQLIIGGLMFDLAAGTSGRSEVVHVRLSPHEKSIIEGKANDARQTTGQYIRSKLGFTNQR